MGPVWRNEKPGPGRFRQFYQCDADTVGAPSVAADAEICAMLADVLEAVGIDRGDYIIRVNNRKVLNGVMEVAGLSGDDKAAERGIVLRAIDKLDRLGVKGVRALLGEGRKDESGDFTKGAGLSQLQQDCIMKFVKANDEIDQRLWDLRDMAGDSPSPFRTLAIGASLLSDPSMRKLMRSPDWGALRNKMTIQVLGDIVGSSSQGADGVAELEDIAALLDAQGYNANRIMIDPSVVRGLGYYTGPVYEAELTFPTLDEKGNPRQFGSVAGGGRYDDLVKRFTGQEVPATGVSIGVDRLLAALNEKGGPRPTGRGPVIVTVMDRDRMADYQSMVADLRRAGIRAEAYLGNPKNFGNQLKYADKRNAPFAIIQGAEELARGVVQIKDLELGKRLSESVSHDEWKEQPAQFECTMTEMIPELLRRLSRDG
jgi:histidyl-tRNA synthetase